MRKYSCLISKRKHYVFLFRNSVSLPSQCQSTRRESKTSARFTRVAFAKEILMLLVFGICLPTTDVYSDVVLIHQLFTNPTDFKCHSHVIPSWWVRDGGDYFGNGLYTNCDDGSDEHGK